MGLLDSLTNPFGIGGKGRETSDLLGFTDTTTEGYIKNAGFDLGNIFLPGGMSGGQSMTQAPGQQGFGGTPLNEADWRELNRVYGAVSDAQNFGDINWNAGNFRGVNFAGNNLSPEAQQFLSDNWGRIRGAEQLGHVDWRGAVGRPNYAQPAAGTPGGTPGSPLGDLEPARGGFAGLAANEIAAAGQNTQGNILELMRTQARPFEQEAFNRINNNLFSRGRLGLEDSATGEAYRGFSRGLAEADTGRQLSAFGLADQLRTSSLNRGLAATQGAAGLTELSTLPFDMALRLAMARSGASLGQANASTGMGQNTLNVHEGFQMFGQGFGGMMSAFSDRRLKTNIKHVGERNGRKWYTWDWRYGSGSAEGVMADENLDIASVHPSGYLMVDYGAI